MRSLSALFQQHPQPTPPPPADAKSDAERQLLEVLGIHEHGAEQGKEGAKSDYMTKLDTLKKQIKARADEARARQAAKINEVREKAGDKPIPTPATVQNLPPSLPLSTTTKETMEPAIGIFEFFSYRRLAKAYSSDLSGLIARIDALRLTEISEQMPNLKVQGRRILGVLQLPGGQPLNICPHCGYTLRAARWDGTKISCTNQRCYFAHELPKRHLNISELRLV